MRKNLCSVFQQVKSKRIKRKNVQIRKKTIFFQSWKLFQKEIKKNLTVGVKCILWLKD
jgi:hypothetical protein